MKLSTSPAVLHVLILLNRLALGWFILHAGWVKVSAELNDGLGTFLRGNSFGRRSPDWLPDWFAAPYGYALPWGELVLGALLVVGLFARATAGLTALLLLSIGVALLGTGELMPRHHVMVFLPLALTLFVLGPGRYSLDALVFRRGV